MKILHSSDWHLGKFLCNKKLINEQALLFEDKLFPLIKYVSPDLIIVSGDIVDKPNPDYETLRLLKEILVKLAELEIPTIFILGNHDSKRLSLFKEFFEFKKLYFVDDLTYLLNPFIYLGKNQRFYFYIFPYFSIFELVSLTKTLFNEGKRDQSGFFKDELSLEEILGQILSYVEIRKPAIFVGHFAVSEAILTGEENSLRMVGKEDVLSAKLLDPFDAVFLGHLHRLQKPFPKVFYSGSPMPYSFEEANYKKGVWLVELSEKGLRSYEAIFIDPPIKIKTLKGYFEELIKHKKDESYIRIILKNTQPVFRPYERLKVVFPNLLELRYEELEGRDGEASSIALDLSHTQGLDLDESKLFKRFYEFVTGKPIEEYIFSAFRECLREYKSLKEESL